jgi:Flp pilus assembly protein TadG
MRILKVRRRLHGDRGAGTVFGLFLVTVVLILAGVVVEAGNVMQASGHATGIAQQAARAGADKLDLETLRTRGLVRLDPDAAKAAALAYLASIGETGTVTATTTRVTVTVSVTRPAILAPVVGIDSVTVQASANAAPQPG